MEKEQYSIDLDSERNLVRVVVCGEIRREDGEQIITRALSTAAKHGYNVFCDVRKATVKVTLVDWFDMPRTLRIFKNEKTRLINTAVLIYKGEQEEGYRFYETVSHNLGRHVRIFLKEKDALEWLRTAK